MLMTTRSLNNSSTWTGGDRPARHKLSRPSKIDWSQPRVVHEYKLQKNESNHDNYESKKPIQVKSIQCNHFIVNNQTVDYKLRCVSDCLVHLNTEHTTAHHQARRSNPQYHRNYLDSSLQHHNNQFIDGNQSSSSLKQIAQNEDGNRIKRTVGIYRILLKLLPLEAHLELDSTAQAPRNELAKLFRERHFNPLDARQQVLDLIECQLNGYCDSIDRLRCILRSDTMLAVICAFDSIVRNIITHNDERLKEDLLKNQSAVDRGKFEFRIVQEWKI